MAHQLGMAVRSVQLMVDRGELEAWKTPGGHRRISRLSVELWMAQRRTGAGAGTGSGTGIGTGATAALPEATGRAEAALQAQVKEQTQRRATASLRLRNDAAPPAAPMPAMPVTPVMRQPLTALQASIRVGGAPVRPSGTGALAAAAYASASNAAAPDRGCVLVIEDSKHYQNLVSLLLREHFPQLDVKLADDGIAGLAMVGQLRPRVLIVDILLPGIDGATLIMSLRSHPQFATSGLLVITSLDDADIARYRFALEGVPVVHKSRVIAELPQQLRRLLDAAPWSGEILSRRHDDR